MASRKSYEMTFEIGGKVASSLATSFKRASGNIDDLKDSAKKAKRELTQLNRDFRQGKLSQDEYAAATANVKRELEQLQSKQARVKAFSEGMNKTWDTTKAAAKIATVTTAVAATAVAMKSLSTAADFEAQMSKVESKIGATSEEMKALNDTALKLGSSTSLSSSEVALAMDGLAAKGFDANKIIGAMPGIIAGAEASGEDLALVSDTVATAINIWGLEAKQASKVSDVLAMSANVSAAGVEDLAYAFKYAGTPAAALGISLEEVAAATGIMTDAGLDGSSAGTSLRAALLRLNSPTKANEKTMKQMGFTMHNANGEAKDLAQIVDDLKKSTEGQTDAQKAATVASLVGTEAVSGFLSLISAGPDKMRKMTQALDESEGSAAKAAAVLKDNYAGALEQLQGSLEAAQIKMATPVLPVLQKAFKGVSGFVDGEGDVFTKIGEKAADSLSNILAPISSQKPELTAAIKNDPEARKEYEKQLAEYMQFKDMKMGDRITYMLDEAVGEVESWMSGEGGKAIENIFKELGEIGAKAWYSAFTGAVKGSVESLADGNIAGAAGMGAAAYMLGGGALVKGGAKVGKWGYDKVKGSKGSKAGATTSTHPKIGPAPTGSIPHKVAAPVYGPAASGSIAAKGAASAATSAGAAGRLGGALGVAGKFVGKAALPVAIVSETVGIAKSDDKTKAAVQGASGIAGGLAGAKLGATGGAALGSIVPGLGTAIGAAIGSAVGGIGGFAISKWGAGKAVDAARGGENKVAAAPAVANTSVATKSVTDASAKFTTDINNTLGKVSEFANTIPTLIETTNQVNTNMQSLAAATAEAPGWVVGGLFGIRGAGEEVQSALRDLASRIRSADVPGASGRLNYE